MQIASRSVDEDHAMDTKVHLCVFILFLLTSNASGKLGDLKLCVVGNPKLKSTRTTKYCDLLGKSKRTPVSCLYAADRLECLLAVSRRKADFSVFEPEDLYFSTLWDESSILVVSEIRALRKKPFKYGIVAMVRKESNITGIGDLRGKRLCHPGVDGGSDWTTLLAQYFEERVAPANCDQDLSVYEDRIKTTSGFFGSACKAGPWSSDAEEDVRLKKKYWNLCSLCDGGDCSPSDKYRGGGGSLICFKDGVGDVLWAKHEDVKAHMKFLGSDLEDPEDKYSYLCDDGSLMSFASEEPCLWLAKPWQVIGANRKSAMDVQKIVDVLSDDEHYDWEENLLHVIELYLEYLENVQVARTPEDYLRRIPGYLSASAMSQSNCKPTHSVTLCVSSGVEEQKCDWISKAGSALGIQPSLECVQKPNFTACLDSVQKKEADVVSVPPDYYFDAAVKYNLRNILFETGSQLNDSYVTSVVSKKLSGLKNLSDLRGKKICLTRKHGIGWWGLLLALNRESLIGSPCEGPKDYFRDVCVLEGDHPSRCCSTERVGDPEVDVLRCLQKDGCDAAVIDSNTLKGISDREKDLRFSDFRSVCGEAYCHWVWSPPHILMSHSDVGSPKALEIFNVFIQLGQYFGRNSRKNNPMLEIFGPFHDVSNVLFRDVSTSFVATNQSNLSNSLLESLNELNMCSKASLRRLEVSSSIFTFTFIWVAIKSTNLGF